MAAVKMKYGLLWYDADKKRPAREKIDEAVERYAEKFGAVPDTCYVHPNSPVEHPQLRILQNPLVLPNHFLVGVEHEASSPSLPVPPSPAVSPQPSAGYQLSAISGQPPTGKTAPKSPATRKAAAKTAVSPAPMARTNRRIAGERKTAPVPTTPAAQPAEKTSGRRKPAVTASAPLVQAAPKVTRGRKPAVEAPTVPKVQKVADARKGAAAAAAPTVRPAQKMGGKEKVAVTPAARTMVEKVLDERKTAPVVAPAVRATRKVDGGQMASAAASISAVRAKPEVASRQKQAPAALATGPARLRA